MGKRSWASSNVFSRNLLGTEKNNQFGDIY